MGAEKLVHSTKRDDWLTPSWVIELAGEVRDVELDPCASADQCNWFAVYNCNGTLSKMPWHLIGDDNKDVDGLALDWCLATEDDGLVFMNPPYGGRKGVINAWINKAGAEAARGAEIIGLVPASTGARWFGNIWRTAQAICFPKGRLRFGNPDAPDQNCGSATFWSAIPYWGPAPAKFISVFGGVGAAIQLGRRPALAESDGRSLGRRAGQRGYGQAIFG